mmetsp:Transcript_23178/g.34915  ORF Transcript_23178/g.34915 Transcript_23178/m.34915 type:complete len:108 (-) Transcript_23178:422-745(-)
MHACIISIGTDHHEQETTGQRLCCDNTSQQQRREGKERRERQGKGREKEFVGVQAHSRSGQAPFLLTVGYCFKPTSKRSMPRSVKKVSDSLLFDPYCNVIWKFLGTF